MIGYTYTLTNEFNGKSFSIGMNDDGTTFCSDGRGLGLQQYPVFELEVRNEERDKSGQHGIWDFYSFYGKRNITFAGTILASSHADLVRLQNKIREVLTLPSQPVSGNDGYITITWTDALDIEWQVSAKIQQDIEFRRDMGQQTKASFFFNLKASDPYILSSTSYDVTQLHGWRDSIATVPLSLPDSIQDVFFNKLSLYQAGSAESPATYRIYGPLTNPKITKLSETASNETEISDFDSGTAWTGDNTLDTEIFQRNDEAQKMTSTGDQEKMRLTGALDLSDPKYISFYFYVDNVDNMEPALLSFPEDTNLVGAWLFNEGSGSTAYDKTSYGNDGTISGATYATGLEGYALSFDNTDYVSLPSTDLPTGAITVSVWVKASAYTTNRVIWHDYAAAGDWCIYSDGTNWVWGVRDATNTEQLISSAHGSDTASWHHLVGYYDGTTQRFYIDGAEVGTPNTFAVTLNTGGTFRLSHDAFDTFEGLIDAVHIYSVGLTEAEISALYQNPGGDLLGKNYIRFIETEGGHEFIAPFSYGNETIQNGWNYFVLLREQFEQIGEPSWDDIAAVELSIKARTGTTLNVTFADLYAKDIEWSETYLEIEGSIAADDYYEFDSANGTIEDSDGNDVSIYLTTDSNWFYMSPKQNHLVLESDDNPVVTFDDPYVFEDGVVGYWPLDEASGTQAQDQTDNNNHLTLNGDAAWVQVGETEHGIGLIDDSTCYIEGTSPVAAATVTSASIMLRYKFDTFDVDHSLFFRLFGHTASPRLYYTTSTDILTLSFVLDGTTRTITVADFSTLYDTGVFIDFACVFDCLNTGTVLYIDGEEAGSDSNLGNSYDGGSALMRFGSDTDLSYSAAGVIEEIVIFDEAATAAEVAEFSETKPYHAVYQDQLLVTFQHAML